MFGWIRALLRIEVRVSELEAVGAAKAYCEQHGWSWVEPIEVKLGLRKYVVVTNADGVGGNIFLSVDCATGVVSSHGPSPR